MTLRQNPELQQRIRQALAEHPGLTSSQVARWLGEDARAVSWEIVVMTHHNELQFEEWRPARYWLAGASSDSQATG